jgi:ADP-ribose pyrophosphatase YjhB (NUDIX family)
MPPQWLLWAQRLQALSQSGIAFSHDVYDLERYGEISRIAAEMMAQGSGLPDPELLAAAFAREIGYATPKVDIRAGVFRDERILLVQEREDEGRWSLPGGWADVGDSPAEVAVREVREESGYEVVAVKLAAVLDRNRHGHPPLPFHVYKFFFLCELVGGEAKANHEIEAADWFAEDALPPLSITRVTEPQISMLFRYRRQPDLPARFD